MYRGYLGDEKGSGRMVTLKKGFAVCDVGFGFWFWGLGLLHQSSKTLHPNPLTVIPESLIGGINLNSQYPP